MDEFPHWDEKLKIRSKKFLPKRQKCRFRRRCGMGFFDFYFYFYRTPRQLLSSRKYFLIIWDIMILSVLTLVLVHKYISWIHQFSLIGGTFHCRGIHVWLSLPLISILLQICCKGTTLAVEMDIISNQISRCTDLVHSLLTSLNIQPTSYLFLFPAGKDADMVKQLVADGVFPTIPGLAPAITYAIVLSILRFTMNHAMMKVTN